MPPSHEQRCFRPQAQAPFRLAAWPAKRLAGGGRRKTAGRRRKFKALIKNKARGSPKPFGPFSSLKPRSRTRLKLPWSRDSKRPMRSLLFVFQPNPAHAHPGVPGENPSGKDVLLSTSVRFCLLLAFIFYWLLPAMDLAGEGGLDEHDVNKPKYFTTTIYPECEIEYYKI